MIAAFSRGPGDTVLVELRAAESRLLADLFGDLIELLAEESRPRNEDTETDPLAAELGLDGLGDDTPTARPDDPALARLFPDAYPDDPDATADFRRYTQPDLTTNAGGVRPWRSRLSTESRPAAGGARSGRGGRAARRANDLRLVLGTRLEIAVDDQQPGEGFGPDHPYGVRSGVLLPGLSAGDADGGARGLIARTDRASYV